MSHSTFSRARESIACAESLVCGKILKMDPVKFYLALYRIGNYVERARSLIQKEDLPAAMAHAAEISEIANRLYRALNAANTLKRNSNEQSDLQPSPSR